MPKPKIAIIGTGGTISSHATHEYDYIDYPETGEKLNITDVITEIPLLWKFAEVLPVPFSQFGSSAITPKDWIRLVDVIEATVSAYPDISGILILHGTAALEETSYFLNLILKIDIPVVLVGAQRPLNTISSDAKSNVIAALRVVCCSESYGQGVLVVMNDEIHSARDVSKTSTYRLHAFKSEPSGPLGVVDPDRVIFLRKSVHRHTKATEFFLDRSQDFPRVDIIYSAAGNDEVHVNASLAAGAKGIVSAGFAPGMPSLSEKAALMNAALQGVTVVQSSRVMSGRVARRSWLKENHWISANDLNPQKARILLMATLAISNDLDWIQECFNQY